MAKTTKTKPKYWAAYVGTVKYGIYGITLHATEEQAYESIADYIGTEREYGDAPEDLAELQAWIEEHADEDGTDWYVQEVETP